MAFKLSARSKANLKGVHPDLKKVVNLAIQHSRVDFAVLDGKRTEEEQRDLLARGATKIMNSRHLNGFAVDLGVWHDGAISWHWPQYIILAADVKAAAADLRIPIEWGGDWPHFKDGGHFELPRGRYPDPHQ